MSDYYVSTEAWRAEQWKKGSINHDVEHVREFLDQDGSRLGGFHRVRHTGQHIREGEWIVRPTGGPYRERLRRTKVLSDEKFQAAFRAVLPELRWMQGAPSWADKAGWHRLADKELKAVLCGTPIVRFPRDTKRLYGEDPPAGAPRCERCVQLDT